MHLASSTVMTPSLPTFSIASAMIFPIASSLLAEMVPTWAIILPFTGLLSFFSSSVTAATALSIPRLSSMGLAPGGDVLGALAVDGLGQDRRRGGAVAGHVGRLARDLLHHLGAHVLQGVLELDLLGHRHPVLGDERRAELLVQDDVAAPGAERDLDRVGQAVDAPQDRLP